MIRSTVVALALLVGTLPTVGQVVPQDLDKLLERADAILEESKALYEEARTKSSVEKFVDAGFKLEEARIKYFVLQEIGSPEKQKVASDRIRAANQLSKLIHDGKVAVAKPSADSPLPSPPPAPAAPETPADTAKPDAASAKAVRSAINRASVPEAARQKEAESLMKDLYKEQYSKKTPADREVLVKLLLAQSAKSQDDLPSLWVLLREAQDIAVQECYVTGLLEAIESTARFFDVDGLMMKQAALNAAAKGAKTPAASGALGNAQMALADELVAVDRYDLAVKAVASAVQHAKKSGDASLVSWSGLRSKEISEAQSLYQSMKSVLETLAKSPDDPAASGEMGKYLCFVKGSWDLGLRFLIKSSDPALKGLAEKETASLADPSGRMAVADGWWDYAEKEKSPLRKSQLIAHVGALYEAVLPDATGLVKAKVEKRLSELKGGGGGSKPVSRAGLVVWWKCDEGKGTGLANAVGGGNEGTLMNGVEWVPGSKGSALKFNGSTRYVAFKPRNLPATNAPQSLLWRLNLSAAPVREENILCLSDDAPTGAIQAGLTKDLVSVRGYKSQVLVTAPVPSLNVWHHVAYVFDGTRHSLYIDGKLEKTSNVAPQTATVTKCELGRWWGGASGLCYYGGALDDVRIYNRALSDDEVQAIARGAD